MDNAAHQPLPELPGSNNQPPNDGEEIIATEVVSSITPGRDQETQIDQASAPESHTGSSDTATNHGTQERSAAQENCNTGSDGQIPDAANAAEHKNDPQPETAAGPTLEPLVSPVIDRDATDEVPTGPAPNGYNYVQGRISVDSNGRGKTRPAGTLGINIGREMDLRHLADLENGMQVALFIFVMAFKLVGVIVGRASRPRTIYVRREALAAFHLKEHDLIFFSIANVDGQPPAIAGTALVESLADGLSEDQATKKIVALAKKHDVAHLVAASRCCRRGGLQRV